MSFIYSSSLQTNSQNDAVSDKEEDISFKYTHVNYNELNCSESYELKLPEEISNKIYTNKSGLGFIKPTLQWNNRCNSSDNSTQSIKYMGIESIRKL